MTLEIEVSEHYERLLEELRKNAKSDPDEDLRQIVEEAIHNGYQEMQSGQR